MFLISFIVIKQCNDFRVWLVIRSIRLDIDMLIRSNLELIFINSSLCNCKIFTYCFHRHDGILVVTRESVDLGLTDITESFNSTPLLPSPPHTSPRSPIFINNKKLGRREIRPWMEKKEWSMDIIGPMQQLQMCSISNVSGNTKLTQGHDWN